MQYFCLLFLFYDFTFIFRLYISDYNILTIINCPNETNMNHCKSQHKKKYSIYKAHIGTIYYYTQRRTKFLKKHDNVDFHSGIIINLHVKIQKVSTSI